MRQNVGTSFCVQKMGQTKVYEKKGKKMMNVKFLSNDLEFSEDHERNWKWEMKASGRIRKTDEEDSG